MAGGGQSRPRPCPQQAGRGSGQPQGAAGPRAELWHPFTSSYGFSKPLTIFLIKTIKVFIRFVYCSIRNAEKRFAIITYFFFFPTVKGFIILSLPESTF